LDWCFGNSKVVQYAQLGNHKYMFMYQKTREHDKVEILQMKKG